MCLLQWVLVLSEKLTRNKTSLTVQSLLAPSHSCHVPDNAVAAAVFFSVCLLQWVLVLSEEPDSKPEHFKEAFEAMLQNANRPV
jgi:hypothetical protein